MSIEQIRTQLQEVVQQWISLNVLKDGELFVVGCSTSEVAGEKIGTSGSREIAEAIFNELKVLEEKTGVYLAFQCCEHLNRAVVVSKAAQEKFSLTEVSAIPVPGAGGQMAAYAFQHMDAPVLVESIRAHAGMDIGDTFIGMHLKEVVIPIRLNNRNIGSAHLTCATTRPKLIGGARAVYSFDVAQGKVCD